MLSVSPNYVAVESTVLSNLHKLIFHCYLLQNFTLHRKRISLACAKFRERLDHLSETALGKSVDLHSGFTS